MQNYLEQLIGDMRQAAKNLPPKPYYDIPPEAEGIEYVIEWVSEGELQLELCDLNPDNCPFTSEYCMCKDFEDEMDMVSNNILPKNDLEENELPF